MLQTHDLIDSMLKNALGKLFTFGIIFEIVIRSVSLIGVSFVDDVTQCITLMTVYVTI